MEQRNSTVAPNEWKNVFHKVKKNRNNLKLPNEMWSTGLDVIGQMFFLRFEKNCHSYLSVSLITIHLITHYRSKKVKWITWDKPKEEKDVENILELVNKIIYSEMTFM